MNRDTPEDIIECSNCGRQFDLAQQNYYSGLCPSCQKDENPRSTWPSCFICSDRAPPDERESVKVTGRTGTEHLPAHTGCAEGYEQTPMY